MHHTASYTAICQMTADGRGPRREAKVPDLAAHLESIGWDLVLGANNRDPQTFAKGLREARELAERMGKR